MAIPSLKNHEKRIKTLVLITLIFISCFLAYYFRFIINTHAIYSHFFYLPVILACYWWKKKGLIIAFFLSGILMIYSFFSSTNNVIIEDFIRCIIIITVGKSISILRNNISKKDQKVRESEEKYRTLVKTAPNSIVLLDSKLNVVECNKIAEKYLNLTRESAIGKNLFDIYVLSKERKNWLFKQVRKRLSNKNSGPVEFEYIDYKNEKIWTSCNFSFFKIGDKDYIQVISEDITEKKKAQKLIIEENKKLLELEKIRKDFMMRISHELRTPLVSVCGSVDYLLNVIDEKYNSQTLDYLENIENGGKRLKGLVNDLIDTSKVEKNKLTIKKQNENLDEIIRNCIKNNLRFAEEREISIEFFSENNIYLNIDKIRIEQVFSNLLSNAVKNTPRNGYVYITLEESKSFIEIRIEDTGVGFAPEEKVLLFKKFGKIERYGKGMDINTEGTGLGLFISKEIVELHGGKIWMESEGRNKGSTFIVSLPMDGN